MNASMASLVGRRISAWGSKGLGFDIGTGGSRAILLDRNGQEAAAVSVPHREVVMERPLWAEQAPENWADAAFEAIRGALSEAGVSGAADGVNYFALSSGFNPRL